MEARHLISPNLHVILVHFPLGIFVFGLFLETFSFLWRRSTVRVAGQWMILFGGLLAVPAALTGIDALRDVWEKLDVIPRALIVRHLTWASWGAGIAAVTTTLALGLSDHWRRRLYLPILLALIASASLMGFGSHFGGEGVYLRGIAVQIKGKPATGIEYYAPAQSTHVLLAGVAIAVALGALGASLRVLSTHRIVTDQLDAELELDNLNAATVPATEPRRVTDDMTVARTLNADAVVPLPRVPAARFWLLSTLVFLMALGFGVWLLLSQNDGDFLQNNKPTPAAVWKEVRDASTASKQLSTNRRGAHVVVGATLVVLPLLLALFVRFGPRQRAIVVALCLLMAVLIAAEIWLGVLLIHDNSEGPLYKFTPPDQATLMPAVA